MIRLKNFLVVVDNLEESIKFYRDVFDMEVVLQNEGNTILTSGLVLQEKSCFEDFLDKKIIKNSSSFEIYFETDEIEYLINKLNNYKNIEIVKCVLNSWGRRVISFYDINGILIEVGENKR